MLQKQLLYKFENEEVQGFRFFFNVMPETYWTFSEKNVSLTPGNLLKHVEPQRLIVTACFRFLTSPCSIYFVLTFENTFATVYYLHYLI